MSKKKAGRKSGSWDVASYSELEVWRAEKGLPKTAVCKLLGVTCSTYHNWARGTSVATPSAQKRIRSLIDNGVFSLSPAGGNVPAKAIGVVVSAWVSVNKKVSPEDLVAAVREVRKAFV